MPEDQVVDAQILNEDTPQPDREVSEKEIEERLRQATEQKIQKCSAEISAALQKYGLDIAVNTILTHDQRIVHQVVLVKRQQQQPQT
jgi:hypothetical protein